MRQRLLTQLLQVPQDLDYVLSFQELARVNLELRRQGPSPQRLLRRAHLERDAGNHAASLTSCQEALALDPQNGEMHYQLGVALLFLSLAKAEALPVGANPSDVPHESVSVLLSKASEAFATALRLNPQDHDAREDLSIVRKVLNQHPSDDDLSEALRSRSV